MILKGQPISFDRKNQPDYVVNFNIAMICFFIGWFILCLPPLIAVGLIFGESAQFFITLSCVFGAFFLGVLILYIVALKLRERIVSERAAKLEEKYSDMPLEEAEAVLKERGVITDFGFVSQRDSVFGDKIVPFDKADIFISDAGRELGVSANHLVLKSNPLRTDIYAYLYDGIDEGASCAKYVLDRALFNFLDKKNIIKDYEENRNFFYLKEDKKNFCRNTFGFRLK